MPLFSWKRAFKPTFDAPLAPDVPFYAVGDIHGRADLLRDLLDRLGEIGHPTARLVCVGDYIDRGDQSAQVLDLLQEIQADNPAMAVCLMGNHEQMLLDFIDDPVRCGPRWLRNGGLQTMASYRLAPVVATASPESWTDARDRLNDAMGPTLDWLRGLPHFWHNGNVAVVHAAADPALPIDEQTDSTLLWGHPDFTRTPRNDGTWVVHGHTIMDRPTVANGRVAVDTGAFATGRLTAAFIEAGNIEFF